jgi:hypothetical protein
MTPEARVPEPTNLSSQLALVQMVTGHYLSRAIHVAAELGIADLLGEGPRHCADLARATGTHERSLHRLMRLLASAGVFAEEHDGAFALTAIGRWLRRDMPGSRRAQALLLAGPAQQRTWGGLLRILKTGEAPVATSTFRYLAGHPEEAATFDDAMASGSAAVDAAVAAAYDFSRFGSIVDVGGGRGGLLVAILTANPSLRGVMFDLPHVAEGARERISRAGLTERCEVLTGDFFEGLPGGGDAYILKSVIHNWDDARSVTILEKCRQAMARPGTLLLVEMALPARMSDTPADQLMAGSDVNMLVNVGGRERTAAEFGALFDAAGFALTRIVPTAALSSVIEGERLF